MLFVFFFFQVVYIVHIGTPLVKANDPLLSFTLLFSLVVTFLSSIVFLGEPQTWSCMTSQVGLALGFAVCLSSIMGKFTVSVSVEFSVYLVYVTGSIVFASGKAAVLMLRAQALKAARTRAKAAAKAAKAAAEAAANSGSPDVIATSTNNNTSSPPNPEVDVLTCAHQRAIATIATLIQVMKSKTAPYSAHISKVIM